jgi:hypothetical protein
MMQTDRTPFIAPIGVGAGHVLLVFGLLNWFGYPLDWFVDTAVLQLIALIFGLFLIAFIPVLLFTCTRLVVPLGMGIAGFGIALVSGLTTPHPEFATLGDDLLTMGPFYVGAYANGWYVWLLAYGLGGVWEYAVRTSVDGLGDPLEFSGWHVSLGGPRSVLFGCMVGLVHATVIIILGIEHEGVLPSGWVLGWGLLGMLLLGSIPMLFLIRYQLISPLVGLVTILLMTGVETLSTTSGTPVSSYLLFWPVYFVLILLLVVGEYVLRWSHQKLAIIDKQSGQATNRR